MRMDLLAFEMASSRYGTRYRSMWPPLLRAAAEPTAGPDDDPFTRPQVCRLRSCRIAHRFAYQRKHSESVVRGAPRVRGRLSGWWMRYWYPAAGLDRYSDEYTPL